MKVTPSSSSLSPSVAGMYADQVGAVTCSTCDPGTFSREGDSTCSSCERGMVAKSTGSSECEMCSAGFVPNEDATLCEACDPGTISREGDSTCSSCESGMVAKSTGSSECEMCRKGSIPNEDGTQCLECEAMNGEGWTSLEGSNQCNAATKDWFWHPTDGPKPCPNGGVCDVEGTVITTIKTEEGYGRISDTSDSLYKCGTDNCIGTSKTNSNSSNCREGSGGVLCAVCEGECECKCECE